MQHLTTVYFTKTATNMRLVERAK